MWEHNIYIKPSVAIKDAHFILNNQFQLSIADRKFFWQKEQFIRADKYKIYSIKQINVVTLSLRCFIALSFFIVTFHVPTKGWGLDFMQW